MTTFCAVFQMLCRGQNCKFCHIESYNKTAIDFSFSTHGACLYSIHISLLVFKKNSRSYKMALWLLLQYFFLTHTVSAVLTVGMLVWFLPGETVLRVCHSSRGSPLFSSICCWIALALTLKLATLFLKSFELSKSRADCDLSALYVVWLRQRKSNYLLAIHRSCWLETFFLDFLDRCMFVTYWQEML